VTPGELVKAISIALDLPEETVVQHDRNLAVAGLRTTGARGRNAPHVTYLDAARVIVAMLGSVRTKDSVETIRKFETAKFESIKVDWQEMAANARAQGFKISDTDIADLNRKADPAIDALPQAHNFIEGVAAVISAASYPIEDLDLHLQRFAEMWIECDSLYTSATIAWLNQASARYQRELAPSKKSGPEQPEMPRHQRWARYYGVRQRRNIYGSAIMLLGKAFRDNGLPFETTRDALKALLGSKPAKSKKIA
jgi:hypothetical protein